MRLNVSLMAIAIVVVLTIVATVFRVSTAPERIRMRLESAKASCLNAGGQWLKSGREATCQLAEERAKL